MRDFANLIISERESLSGLIFDADSYKNAGYYRNSYNIPDEERLLVYAIEGPLGDALSGSGTFITDEAIYIHPAKKSWGKESRIPLSDICSFIVYENNSDVKLLNSRRQYQIFAGRRSGKNTTASQLVSLIRSMQNSLIISGNKREEYEKTLKQIFSIVRQEMRSKGVLDETFLGIVRVMEDFASYKREAILLELESAYRGCNRAEYELLLSQKEKDLDVETAKVLKNPENVFYLSFINDLSDRNCFSNVKSLIDSYLRLKNQPKLNLKEASILCHLCVRMGDFSLMEKLLYKMGDDLNKEELWGLLNYAAKEKNLKIHSTLGRIKRGEELTESELLCQNDLGLSLLHYALILEDEPLLDYLLKNCDFKKLKTPFSKDKMASAMFDPMFIATLICKNEEEILRVFRATSPKATALNRSIAGMDAMIEINIAAKKKYPEDRETYIKRASEYGQIRLDLIAELKDLCDAEVKRQRSMAKILKEAGHPLCNYLFSLFESQANLLSWMYGTLTDYRLSKYKTTFFVTGFGVDLDLSFAEYEAGRVVNYFFKDGEVGYFGKSFGSSYKKDFYDNPFFMAREEERKRAEKERERRREEFKERVANPAPFAGSWFSEEAHENISMLKNEYRILVKKYHPDSSKDDSTAKILMRIMNERADILEKMRTA